MTAHSKWQGYVITAALLMILCTIFYFSWIPDNQFSSESYLPLGLRKWSNTYYNLRTAVPFVALGFVLAVWSTRAKVPLKKKKPWAMWWQLTFIAWVVVSLAEGGQWFIASRNPDGRDVGYGLLGSQVGMAGYYLFKKIQDYLLLKK